MGAGAGVTTRYCPIRVLLSSRRSPGGIRWANRGGGTASSAGLGECDVGSIGPDFYLFTNRQIAR